MEDTEGRRWPRAVPVVVAVVLALVTAACGGVRAGSLPARPGPPPFLAVQVQHIPLPASVQPWGMTFTPDGHHILFENQLDGYQAWVVRDDGADLHCITCALPGAPVVAGDVGAFVEAFPDGKRLLVAQDTALPASDPPGPPDAWVVDCAPSLVDCRSGRVLPVDMSADRAGTSPVVMRRTWHLAPDGVHLGWMDVRGDGTMVVIATLRQKADRYVAADPRVIDPAEARSATDTDAVRRAAAGQVFELKGFADGGRQALLVGEPDAINPDQELVDLRTGRVTRLTANVDWDEDGSLSPDGSLDLVSSYRTMHRVDVFGSLPEIHPFIEGPVVAGLAGYYVSTHAGFQCSLTPWLLPGTGDAGGRLVGQALSPYRGGGVFVGADLLGQGVWSPGSTRVLLQPVDFGPPQGTRQEATMGTVPNELLVAHLARPATRPIAVAPSTVGAWAPGPSRWTTPYDHPGTFSVTGPGGGSATVRLTGDFLQGSATLTYHHYSDDGRSFVDGTESVSTATAGGPVDWTLHVVLSGAHRGREDVGLRLTGPSSTGQAVTVLDGVRRAGPPVLGACPASLPRPAPLSVAAVAVPTSGDTVSVSVTVTAAESGAGRLETGVDRRPVRGAVVTVDGRRTRTGASGRATVTIGLAAARRAGPGGRLTVSVDGGASFTPGATTVAVP